MIREARPEDIPELLAIGRKAIEETEHPARYDEKKTRSLLRHAVMIARKKGPMRIWVAEVESKVVGVLIGQVDSLFFSTDRYATDLVFYTLPEYRGYGVGLAKKFLEWARSERKVVDITLQVSSGVGIERTARLYERLGLKYVGGCFVEYKARKV